MTCSSTAFQSFLLLRTDSFSDLLTSLAAAETHNIWLTTKCDFEMSHKPAKISWHCRSRIEGLCQNAQSRLYSNIAASIDWATYRTSLCQVKIARRLTIIPHSLSWTLINPTVLDIKTASALIAYQTARRSSSRSYTLLMSWSESRPLRHQPYWRKHRLDVEGTRWFLEYSPRSNKLYATTSPSLTRLCYAVDRPTRPQVFVVSRAWVDHSMQFTLSNW